MTNRVPDPVITAARTSHRKYFPFGPFISVSLAQWADESAFGTKPSGVNNFFGIKATKAQIAAGEATDVYTKEFINGQYTRPIPLYFANYPSIEACFDAHAQLLITHHYIPCMRATSVEAYCLALHTCGYATEPNYAGILLNIIKENNLTQYDEAA